ncbi:MAG TPA: phosphatase PAP2 family protein [Pyrinomonadaceae bacterium]|nr:phosphatase PAP2 family protein [Pyrinomonadaceae bacterium]
MIITGRDREGGVLPGRARESRRLLRAEFFYLAALAAFAVLAVLAHAYAYFAWDLSLARSIQSNDSRAFAAFMDWASVFGNRWTPHALTVATALAFFIRRRRSEAAGLVLSAGGGSILSNAFKLLVARPRPTAELVGFAYQSSEKSFPSGHVIFYVCYFGFLFFVAYALLPRGSLARRASLVLAALPVAVVGVSRVYLRAHWPSDVLGAYLLSGVWLAFSLAIYRRWKRSAAFHSEEVMSDE